MALDTAPRLTRRRNLAFGLETTTGTPVSLAAADGVTRIFSPSMPFSTEEIDRDSQGTSLSPILTAKGARSGRAAFETELAGAGIFTRLFRGCGCTLTGSVITPITPATETLTIGYYMSGLLKRISGAMGNFTMTLRRGQAGRVAWDFTGVQQPPEDVAQIAPTYVTTIAPRVGATTFTVGGTTFRVPEVVMEKGNEIYLREDIAGVDEDAEPTGYRAAMVTNARTIFRMSPEQTPLSTKDWYDIYRDSTLSALVLNWGADAGNSFALAAPKLQLISDPTEGDRNGLLTNDLVFLATRSADAGDDEWSLTMS